MLCSMSNIAILKFILVELRDAFERRRKGRSAEKTRWRNAKDVHVRQKRMSNRPKKKRFYPRFLGNQTNLRRKRRNGSTNSGS